MDDDTGSCSSEYTEKPEIDPELVIKISRMKRRITQEEYDSQIREFRLNQHWYRRLWLRARRLLPPWG